MTPRVVSHYRLLDVLGEGGMGVVYRAEDLRLGREVAVKLLRTDAPGSAVWLERFEREARLASALQHPHICTIHELGEHEGQPFIVMELLEGLTIRDLVQRGPISPPRVLEFARQTADALDAAHRRGIIHRDIKPANLFVTDGGRLKILDFGVAKATPADGAAPYGGPSSAPASGLGARLGEEATRTAVTAGAELTRTGVTVGTAAYMSPEQALGRRLDPRTDLFSLGTVLYEMATGRRAFPGDDVPVVITMITNGIVLPARMVNPAIPEHLDAIVGKLMATDPDERYQTAADLLQDVKSAVAGSDPASATGIEVGVITPAVAPPPMRRWMLPIFLAAVAIVIAGVLWVQPRAPALTERDSIVIGAVENTTADPGLADALLTALKVQLGQSPFLDIVADQRVRDTLQFMGRKPDERLTGDVTREACQRLGAKAMLEGSVAPLGRDYVLTLGATDCQTGEIIAREQGEAESKERVLRELGRVAKRLRTTLGESLPSIQRFDVPIEDATTPSLSALKAYARGLDERRRGRELESVAFFKEAIDLDPQFASAYVTLSTVYGGLGEWQQSDECARLAYKRRNRVSERERLFVTYQYHDRVTGNADLAVETLLLWKVAYPRDMRAPNALAVAYNRAGRYEEAEVEAREALRRSPGHPFPLSNLAFAYRSMGRYADARRVAEEAVKLGVATSPTHRLLYQLGILAGDGSAAAQVAWGKGRPREFDIVSAQAEVAAFGGRPGEGSDLYRRAADIAVARGLKGTAAGYLAHVAWMEALYREPGERAQPVRRAMAIAPADSEGAAIPRFRAAAALALAGLIPEARALVNRAEERYPEGTYVRTVLAPVTRAAIALGEEHPDAAIEALRAAAPMEFGTVAGLVPGYLRAEALRQKGQLSEALAEYEKVLRNRGVDPFGLVIPMSHLGIARARARAGDLAGSRQAYEGLFAIWKNADVDFRPLAAARAEYQRLGPPSAAVGAR